MEDGRKGDQGFPELLRQERVYIEILNPPHPNIFHRKTQKLAT